MYFSKIENEFIINLSNSLGILFYYRFFNNIFVIFPENVDENELLKIFNNLYKNLRYTLEQRFSTFLW